MKNIRTSVATAIVAIAFLFVGNTSSFAHVTYSNQLPAYWQKVINNAVLNEGSNVLAVTSTSKTIITVIEERVSNITVVENGKLKYEFNETVYGGANGPGGPGTGGSGGGGTVSDPGGCISSLNACKTGCKPMIKAANGLYVPNPNYQQCLNDCQMFYNSCRRVNGQTP